jgi:hypothetical protein
MPNPVDLPDFVAGGVNPIRSPVGLEVHVAGTPRLVKPKAARHESFSHATRLRLPARTRKRCSNHCRITA